MGQCKANEAAEGPREGECGLLESAHACAHMHTHAPACGWPAMRGHPPRPFSPQQSIGCIAKVDRSGLAGNAQPNAKMACSEFVRAMGVTKGTRGCTCWCCRDGQ